jgi:hypothetical protein
VKLFYRRGAAVCNGGEKCEIKDHIREKNGQKHTWGDIKR